MRIIAGEWRGRPLVAPAGMATRPTADRTRETLFSMLVSRLGSLEGLAVVDLFAGTGALGLEALSRGAAECWFVETDRVARDALNTNIAKLGAGDRSRILPRDATAPGSAPRRFDLALLDPPYGEGLAARGLAALVAGDWLQPGAWLSVETGRRETLDVQGYAVEAVRAVGQARLHLLTIDARAPGAAE
jgi:16S rRNA (guanine966-N2)-methyltransferase